MMSRENAPSGRGRKFHAAILDLDGVLVDTPKFHYSAWKRLASELGFDFSNADNERLKGVSRERSLDILLEIGRLDLNAAERKRLADKKNRWYLESIKKIDESGLIPGAREFLMRLRGKGVKLALGSASKNAPLILAHLNISHLFDAIIDGNRVSKTKPHPEVFLLGAREVAVPPGECVVFEDAEAGLQAARMAGMYAVGIGKPEVLLSADFVIGALIDFDVDMLFF
jgi:beta-phosphoglucomutase